MNSLETLENTKKVRSTLISLQKEILNVLKDVFDKENGRNAAPGEWLQILMVSHRYQWLRELTSLIADVDILTELQEVTKDQAHVVRSEVDRLFFHKDSTSEFYKHYSLLMNADAPFIFTQGLLKEAVHKLPATHPPMDHETALEVRKTWHEEHKVQSRKRRS